MRVKEQQQAKRIIHPERMPEVEQADIMGRHKKLVNVEDLNRSYNSSNMTSSMALYSSSGAEQNRGKKKVIISFFLFLVYRRGINRINKDILT